MGCPNRQMVVSYRRTWFTNGRPATSRGFPARALPETSVLAEHLIGSAVDRPEILDRSLRPRRLRPPRRARLCRHTIEAETRLALRRGGKSGRT